MTVCGWCLRGGWGLWVSYGDCVKVVTVCGDTELGVAFMCRSRGPPVSLTGVRRTPIMGA